jgi:hypothetical protein
MDLMLFLQNINKSQALKVRRIFLDKKQEKATSSYPLIGLLFILYISKHVYYIFNL